MLVALYIFLLVSIRQRSFIY